MEWFWDHYADPADRTDPAGVAAARRRPVRPAAGVHRDVRVRPAARRGHRLRRGAGGGRRAGPPGHGPRPHPHVADDGRRGPVGRRHPRRDGRARCVSSSAPRSRPDPQSRRRSAMPRSATSGSGAAARAARLARRCGARTRCENAVRYPVGPRGTTERGAGNLNLRATVFEQRFKGARERLAGTGARLTSWNSSTTAPSTVTVP